MVGYLEILQSSDDVYDDFDVEKEVLVENFLNNPLGLCLVCYRTLVSAAMRSHRAGQVKSQYISQESRIAKIESQSVETQH
jgi:hypothetical protein